MYHALFDIEDFHGLHPVQIDGRYYLDTVIDVSVHMSKDLAHSG